MRGLLTLGLLLALGACALPQERSRAFSPYEPIEAYITTTTSSGPLFHVNRPAYVAMFYIVPGSGVSMIYPGFGRGSLSGRVFAGSHFASNRLSNREHFFFTRSTLGQPRYLFLIASDRPLNVDQFGTFGDGLLSRLGTQFTSYSPYSTMTELARLALPSLVDDGSWTSDFYVLWPSVIYSEPARDRVLVSCGDYAMYVPRGYVEVVRTVICEAQVQERPEEDGEERKVRKPGAREPLPAEPGRDGVEGGERDEIRAITAAQREAIRERVTSSSQLTAPRWRPEVGSGRGELGRAGSDVGRPGSPRAVGSSPDRTRPSPSGGNRPSTPSARSPRPASTPSASPAPSAGGRGPVSAPTSRPSSGSGGGEGSSRGPRSAPSAD